MKLDFLKKQDCVKIVFFLLVGSILYNGFFWSRRNSFEFNNYKINHHYADSAIDLEVSLDFKERIRTKKSLNYPSIHLIKDAIDNFLVKYPNEDDFWEVLNKNLAKELLTKPIINSSGNEIKLNELLDSVSIQMNVKSGSSGIEFPRSSFVRGSIKNSKVNLQEKFSFNLSNYKINHHYMDSDIDLEVSFDFKKGIGVNKSLDYPNITPIKNAIDNFLVRYPNEDDYWGVLNKNLVKELLKEPIITSSGSEINLNKLLNSISIQMDVSNELSTQRNSFETTAYSYKLAK